MNYKIFFLLAILFTNSSLLPMDFFYDHSKEAGFAICAGIILLVIIKKFTGKSAENSTIIPIIPPASQKKSTIHKQQHDENVDSDTTLAQDLKKVNEALYVTWLCSQPEKILEVTRENPDIQFPPQKPYSVEVNNIINKHLTTK